MAAMNRAWIMKTRPEGEPTVDNFELVESPLPEPKHGEILIRSLYQSIDPYMRLRMRLGRSHTPPLNIGDVVVGEVVGRVEESKSPLLSAGDVVAATIGWQEYGVVAAQSARKIDPTMGPISTGLGVLGLPGLTAYFGLLDICDPKADDTLVVSAASGAVGAVVGQIGKINGCRVIGIAGSDEKCSYVVDELGFDAAINYKTQDGSAELRRLCPDGIDVYFDNVGGPVTDAVFENLAFGARIAVCGQVAHYSAVAPPQGPRNLGVLLTTQSRIEGFIVRQFEHRYEIARRKLAKWIDEGRLQYKEDIIDGFENVPSAFIGLLQ
ncbi:MAG: NADP-dependent oxidoreductase [Chloroflexi bacterium]|nr:NADP-dependent oxidoreductase [Chloroflexota bacterium]